MDAVCVSETLVDIHHTNYTVSHSKIADIFTDSPGNL